MRSRSRNVAALPSRAALFVQKALHSTSLDGHGRNHTPACCGWPCCSSANCARFGRSATSCTAISISSFDLRTLRRGLGLAGGCRVARGAGAVVRSAGLLQVPHAAARAREGEAAAGSGCVRARACPRGRVVLPCPLLPYPLQRSGSRLPWARQAAGGSLRSSAQSTGPSRRHLPAVRRALLVRPPPCVGCHLRRAHGSDR